MISDVVFAGTLNLDNDAIIAGDNCPSVYNPRQYDEYELDNRGNWTAIPQNVVNSVGDKHLRKS